MERSARDGSTGTGEAAAVTDAHAGDAVTAAGDAVTAADDAVTAAGGAVTAPERGARLLDGLPRQRGDAAPVPTPPAAPEPPASTAADPKPTLPAPPASGVRVPSPAVGALARHQAARARRLLPTPVGTPFTFGYAVVLVVTSLVTRYADPALVHALHQGSSTDVAHLVRDPLLVLPASALWIVGGVASPYAIGFLLALTALERRIGGWCAAGVFLFGHVVATLATEVPVGLAVLAGHLPDSSLHRLDYGISFGVAASVGALAGLLVPWRRWPLLTVYGAMLLADLIAFTDPMTAWGHLLSLALGVSTWPLLRRRCRTSGQDQALALLSR